MTTPPSPAKTRRSSFALPEGRVRLTQRRVHATLPQAPVTVAAVPAVSFWHRRRMKWLFLLAPLTILLAIAWYLSQGARLTLDLPGDKGNLSASATLRMSSDGPNVTDIRLVQLDGARQSWIMSAPRAQRTGEDRTLIWEPLLTAFPTSGGEIRITARRGEINELTRAMVFQEEVVLVDRDGNRFSTQLLTFDPDQRVLSTDHPFLLEGPRLRLQGVGFTLYQDSKRMLVQREVRAFFPDGI